jgi:SnoaL-like domain
MRNVVEMRGDEVESTSLEERVASLEDYIIQLRKEAGVARRVDDYQEIQNVMGLHEYYHAAGRHDEEMDAIWAQKTPGIAMEEAFLNGRYVGLAAVRGYYVDFFNVFFETMQREVLEIFPQLKGETEVSRPFGVQILHTLTTPVIEVADDGRTAKGIWLSPGYIAAPQGGRLQAFWHWDRYAIDFAKEDGKWKIWHFWVGKDFSTPYEKSWVESALDSAPGVQLDAVPGFPKPNAPSQTPYGGYSPFKQAYFVPAPPHPYKTFSETFSY